MGAESKIGQLFGPGTWHGHAHGGLLVHAVGNVDVGLQVAPHCKPEVLKTFRNYRKYGLGSEGVALLKWLRQTLAF